MALSHKIVEDHQRTIEAVSEQEKGTAMVRGMRNTLRGRLLQPAVRKEWSRELTLWVSSIT
jgi:hypothetical protein